jgi:FkbM family methyltransferase
VIRRRGLWWPDDVGTKFEHSFRHVGALDWALRHCKRHRTAVQAGGNVGLWPRAMATFFKRVITFEPDAICRECLVKNLSALPHVEVHAEALGKAAGHCGLERKSLGSHCIAMGNDVSVVTIDSFELEDVDLLQLDVEGYEWHALFGAQQTLMRCHPLVQVELRGFTDRYGASDDAVRGLLSSFGYCEVSQQPGHDFVFEIPT